MRTKIILTGSALTLLIGGAFFLRFLRIDAEQQLTVRLALHEVSKQLTEISNLSRWFPGFLVGFYQGPYSGLDN
jgi:hypothetical protein